LVLVHTNQQTHQLLARLMLLNLCTSLILVHVRSSMAHLPTLKLLTLMSLLKGFKNDVFWSFHYKDRLGLSPKYRSWLVLSKPCPKPINSTKFWGKKLFSSFLYLNTWISYERLRPHPSFIQFYYGTKDGNVAFVNLHKLYKLLDTVVLFITNIFFYQIRYIVFGTSYFRYEVLALGWDFNLIFKAMWRYTHPFLFFLSNKTTRYTEFYFKYLKQQGANLALLVDVYYHQRTLYYCSRFKFITVGPVPITTNMYMVSVALPTASNSAMSNLFFLRLILKLKRLNSSFMWHSYMETKA
jgi:hypothetical protein